MPACAGFEPLEALLKVTLAPIALGIVAGFQFAELFQELPLGKFHVCARPATVGINRMVVGGIRVKNL